MVSFMLGSSDHTGVFSFVQLFPDKFDFNLLFDAKNGVETS